MRTLPEALIHPFWVSTSLIVVGATLWASRRRDSATVWSLSIAAALLVVPLGWVYYGWILAPMLVAIPRWSRLLKTGMVMLWIPPAILGAFSTATAGLVLVWVALILGPSRVRMDGGVPA